MNHVKAFFLSPAKSYISEGRDLLPCRRTSDPEFESTLRAAAGTLSVLLVLKQARIDFFLTGCRHFHVKFQQTLFFS